MHVTQHTDGTWSVLNHAGVPLIKGLDNAREAYLWMLAAETTPVPNLADKPMTDEGESRD